MRKGTAILVFAFGLFMAGFFTPAWEMFVSAKMAEVSEDQRGPIGLLVAAMSAMSPVQQFLYGAAFGMTLAYGIGYWARIKVWVRDAYYFMFILPLIIRWSRPSDMYLGTAENCFDPFEMEGELTIPNGVTLVTATPDRAKAYLAYQTGDRLIFKRASLYDKEKAVPFTFDLYGRYHFWHLVRVWFALNLPSLGLTGQDGVGFLAPDVAGEAMNAFRASFYCAEGLYPSFRGLLWRSRKYRGCGGCYSGTGLQRYTGRAIRIWRECWLWISLCLSSPASFASADAKRGKGTQALTVAMISGSLGSLPLAPLPRRSAGNDR